MAVYATRVPDVLIEAMVDDGMVGINADSDRCFGLNSTATRIWELVAQPRSAEQICEILCAEFDASREDILTAVNASLTGLAREGLVRFSDADGT